MIRKLVHNRLVRDPLTAASTYVFWFIFKPFKTCLILIAYLRTWRRIPGSIYVLDVHCCIFSVFWLCLGEIAILPAGLFWLVTKWASFIENRELPVFYDYKNWSCLYDKVTEINHEAGLSVRLQVLRFACETCSFRPYHHYHAIIRKVSCQLFECREQCL